MGARVALCIDELTCSNPQAIGLEGEVLESQGWLKVLVAGDEAREAIGVNDALEEIWVASCDDVSAINLAATLKSDKPALTVRLVDFEGGGSLLSRAHTAAIDEVLGQRAFVERYAAEKRRASGKGAVLEAEQATQPSTLALAKPNSAGTGERRRGFVMPVVSGSGGAGKSTVSVLGALMAHRRGYRTLLLDYDLQFGDAAVLLGIENPLTIDAALERPDLLQRELARAEGLSLIAAPTRLELAESIAQAVGELVGKLSESFDVIVANTGASWAEQHAALLELSTAVLFLVDQRASSVRASRHALELCARCGIATGQFQFVLNRCSKNAVLTALDVSTALRGAPVGELKDGGRDVEDYLAAGAAEELLDSGNELCTSLQRVMDGLLPPVGGVVELESANASRGASSGRRRGRHVGKRKGWGR